jgi:acetyltransferase
MLRVYELTDLFTAAETLFRGTPIVGDRLAIITNGGGMGVLATDRLMDEGGRLADLAPETLAKLDKILPPTWSHGNPVDIIGDADGVRYAAALDAVLGDPGVDAILVLNCPTAVIPSTRAARAVAATAKQRSDRAILTSWVGEVTAAEARGVLRNSGMPTYETPETAVRAFMQMVTYRRNQHALLQVPESHGAEINADRAVVRDLIDAAVAKGQQWLSLPDALKCLSAYGIPTVPTRVAKNDSDVSA